MKGCRAISREEEIKILKSFKGSSAIRDKALLTVALYTGYRITESLSMRVSDVFQNGKIVDSVTISKRFMKGKDQSRCVALNQMAKLAIAERLKEMESKGWLKPDMFLFRSQRGGNKPLSRTGAWVMYQKAFRQLSMTGKLGTHFSRKSFAIRMHEKLHFDLIKTQAAMGHKNISSTISYLNFNEPEISQAVLSL
jgi:site-specific recombinase XerD